MIEPVRSPKPSPRSSSRLLRAAPISSAVEERTVAKRQCSTSSSPRKVPKCVWVLPTSTARSTNGLSSTSMSASLYVVNGSHPCATVERALELKGIDYTLFEWPPPMHAPMQWLLFRERTVPALRLDGEKISGSRAILRRLEELRPEPALYPADPEARAKVEEAERWGDEVFQSI